MRIDRKNCFTALMMTAVISVAGGCATDGRFFDSTLLTYWPHRSATKPPVPVPYRAEPLFYGYQGTCWRQWPEGWMACPACAYRFEADEVLHGVEVPQKSELQQADMPLFDVPYSDVPHAVVPHAVVPQEDVPRPDMPLQPVVPNGFHETPPPVEFVPPEQSELTPKPVSQVVQASGQLPLVPLPLASEFDNAVSPLGELPAAGASSNPRRP